jgi:hypothetical protein
MVGDEEAVMFRIALIVSLLVVSLAYLAMAQGSTGPVNFQVSQDIQNRYSSPAPRPGATGQTKKAAIGKGSTAIDTGNPKNLFWTENADLSGAGTVVNADMMWDASSKIFYAFAHTDLRCAHGKSIEGNVLIGVYGKRNILGKTPGAGWWVVELAQNQCQAPLAGLYGCKFDGQGDNLACGRAELDPRINDMAIVEAMRF